MNRKGLDVYLKIIGFNPIDIHVKIFSRALFLVFGFFFVLLYFLFFFFLIFQI